MDIQNEDIITREIVLKYAAKHHVCPFEYAGYRFMGGCSYLIITYLTPGLIFAVSLIPREIMFY